MANGNGISGLAVALAAAGGVLVYAGFKGMSPVGALRDVSGGHPTGVTNKSTDLGGFNADGATAGSVADSVARTVNVLAAAQPYMGDKYSQARRTQSGYSDCSSFCDKILTRMGISPPTKWASTANFRISGNWVNVTLADTQPGDIAINSHHMVMITQPGGTSAIGQQNPRVNVRTGTVKDLMSNDYVCKRYVEHPGKTGKVATL
jgi:hypothetical protein